MSIKNDRSQKIEKKIVILYDSRFGNTKNIAISLSRGLEAGGCIVDSFHILNFNIDKLFSYNIVGLGGPTHFRGMSKPMKEFLNQLERLNLESKEAFVFETKADFKLAGSSGKKIMKILAKSRMKIIYPLISCIVINSQGPLVSNTLHLMEKTGLKIAELLYKGN